MKNNSSYPMPDCLACKVKQHTFLQDASAETLQWVCAQKRHYYFDRDHLIFGQGKQATGIFVLYEGAVKLCQQGPDGKEQIVSFATSGDIIGYRALLGDGLFELSAYALDPVQACFIDKKQLFDLLNKESQYAVSLLKIVSQALSQSTSQVMSLAQKKVPERLAEILLMLEQKFGTDPNGFVAVNLKREELATMLGASTENCIRQLAEFSKSKLISLDKKKIKLENKQALVRLATLF